MKNLSLIALAALTVVSVGCGKKAKNDWLMSPPVEYDRAENKANVDNAATPQIEILFVIDNSKSMDKHIQNLASNIDQFVDALGSNLPFPFHVGVTTVYDGRGALSATKAEPGQLVEVKNEKSEVVAGKYFSSSADENRTSLLKNTLKVGTLALADGGPEVEEMFTPVASFYGFGKVQQSAKVQANHKQFFMGPNAHKVIFFITDASDNSAMTGSELLIGLKNAAGGDAEKVMAYGALIKPTANAGCAKDPGMKNNKLPRFLSMTKSTGSTSSGHILDLCSGNFGRRLAEVGSEIREETITRVIRLSKGRPDYTIDPNSKNFADGEGIWVTYGTEQDITKRQRLLMETAPGIIGYTYDARVNGISINPKFRFDVKPGAQLRIDYTPINQANVQRGLVKPWIPNSKTKAQSKTKASK